ncbi:LysM peptidoglycan-binding domain-containing protein, partial [Bacteroidales bacterium OttesenSCG-928-B11]|nr:LysM peptidoglycan-binding domain-containing protein [Bacteroidales bacterium OttesenSCG-928-B11]
PIEGEVIYIQAKNKKSPIAYHTIKMGESPRYIAQKYAVPLEILYQRNNYSAEEFSVNNIICIACKK